MATLLLSAAGAAVGSGFGGSILGLSGAVIGRAVGATIGRVIDQRALSGGSEPVETGRVDRFRVNGAGEGAAIPQLWGRMRLSGQVIWASRFTEYQNTTGGGGKGGGGTPATTTFGYTVSLAIALCEGPTLSLGRVWADGVEIDASSLPLRFYTGSETQMPDPKIEAVEGAGNAPAYRGISYVVLEELDLSPYGSRVPQFSFEVTRNQQSVGDAAERPFSDVVPGVCIIPGSGEYALATTPVRIDLSLGQSVSQNVHTKGDRTDFRVSLDRLRSEVPDATGASLIVSWFGDDLRCGQCKIRPKVERSDRDGVEMPWQVSGLTRTTAQVLAQSGGGAIYGGSPTDQSVIEAIQALRAEGMSVTFYPFILMEQIVGNARPDPYGGAEQAAFPWRGRITTAIAPGRPLTTDRTAAASAEVTAFFGQATAGQFTAVGQTVSYTGPDDWGLRRFILHYAKLCVAAGGVDSFLIGSELVGLMRIRGAGDSFPAVAAMRSLAAEVRGILGPATKISYASDWSEYFGLQADGNRYFHLDPLWADTNVDFIGVDNYLPCADWRGTAVELDVGQGGPTNIDYLKANIGGGEGYDWYYANDTDRAAQVRTPITDLVEGEPWVWRSKDFRGWWSNAHYDRINGVKASTPSSWVPMSKPFRFTEYGCAAIDKAANQPNRFLDPKSSESGLPFGSNGARDDLGQLRYYQAMAEYWEDGENNPVSPLYLAAMLDFQNSHVWAWDARPFPAFPGRSDIWSDTGSYETGHWLNGRISNQGLGAVLADQCAASGLTAVNVSQVSGVVRGYLSARIQDGRALMQPLLQAHGLDVADREGLLSFLPRTDSAVNRVVTKDMTAVASKDAPGPSLTRLSNATLAGKLVLSFVEDSTDYPVRIASAIFPGLDTDRLESSDLPLLMTEQEARMTAERWLAETAAGREVLTLDLPLSFLDLGIGDKISYQDRSFRIDRMSVTDRLEVEAVSCDGRTFASAAQVAAVSQNWRSQTPTIAQPVYPILMDLPLLRGDEVPHSPHIAVASAPWQGDVAVWSSESLDGFQLNQTIDRPSMIGLSESVLAPGRRDLWDRGAGLLVRFASGTLSSVAESAVLNGGNVAVIGDGTPENWEVFQFATATLVAPGLYALSNRLRGLAGSDAFMTQTWPVGSHVVILAGAAKQLSLPIASRGVTQNLRIAPVSRGYDSPTATARQASFLGIGLRPYAPCHLGLTVNGSGDRAFSWIRRTRIGGDSWLGLEVPVSEENESYDVVIRQGTTVLRQTTTTGSAFSYTQTMQVQDMASGPLTFSVGQISALYGAGVRAQINFTV